MLMPPLLLLLRRLGRPLCAAAALAAALFAGPAPAQPVSPPQPEPTAARPCPPATPPLGVEQVQQGMRDARDRGYLWRIRKDGRDSWLYGTLHVARLPWMFPGPKTLRALRESDRLALELDLLDPDISRRLQALIAAHKDVTPLPALLATRMAAQTDAACVGTKLGALRPEMQAVTLMALAGRPDGLDPSYGIDNFLAGLAHGLKKPVLSLETPEAQIALLSPADTAERNKMVQTMLDELERGDAQRVMLRMAMAWADGRLDELQSYGDWCDCLDTPEQRDFHRRLVDERNLVLARRIDAIHEAGHRVF
ncbi:MAG TPA: TraB/GumN family protein, partial [Ideonella sp.]|nr:TraB/GumN family protein [Ideonella sp.]